MKINLGCGHAKNEGYVNVDCNPEVKPDLVFNFCGKELPWETGSCEEVTILHTIEHIPRLHHPSLIGEINRILEIGGTLIVSFPNAARTLQAALDNKHGMRYSYWESTILGRVNNIWDVHQCLMFSDDFVAFLSEYGFGSFKVIEEVNQPHNAVIQAVKKFHTVERAELLRREVIKDAVLGQN